MLSGKVYYIYAQILEATGEYKKAYDYYYKAAWAADSVSKAMKRIAVLDIRNKDYKAAVKHAETALDYGRNDSLAAAVKVIALKNLGKDAAAEIAEVLEKDRLDHYVRYLSGAEGFYDIMNSNPLETVLDIASDFDAMGLLKVRTETAQPMLYYALGYYKYLCGGDGAEDYINGSKANIGATFPLRKEEMRILENVILKTDDSRAKMLLGSKAEVNEIFHYIATIGIEYFSNMHLKEPPYYQARAWQHLGEEIKA